MSGEQIQEYIILRVYFTSSILITEIWKSPDVSKANSKSHTGHDKVHLSAPCLSIWIAQFCSGIPGIHESRADTRLTRLCVWHLCLWHQRAADFCILLRIILTRSFITLRKTERHFKTLKKGFISYIKVLMRADAMHSYTHYLLPLFVLRHIFWLQ